MKNRKINVKRGDVPETIWIELDSTSFPISEGERAELIAKLTALPDYVAPAPVAKKGRTMNRQPKGKRRNRP